MRNNITILLLLLGPLLNAQTQITASQAPNYVGIDVVLTGYVLEKSYIETSMMAECNLFLGDNVSIDLYGDNVLLCGDDVLDHIKPGASVSIRGVVECVVHGKNVAYRIIIENCNQFVAF